MLASYPALLMVILALYYCQSYSNSLMTWWVAAFQYICRQKTRVRNWLKENVTLSGGYAWLHWAWSVVDTHKSVWFDISAAILKFSLHSNLSPYTTWSTVIFLIWVWMMLIIDKRWSACTIIMALFVMWLIFKTHLRTRRGLLAVLYTQII